MRTDVLETFEDFERVAEDYFWLIPPDTDSFLLEKCISWSYDDFDNTMTFRFDNEWDLDEFNDKMADCPKFDESFDYYDELKPVDRENLSITIQGKESGLI